LFENKIKFIATDGNMKDIWPNPKPASRFIPDEYKKLKRFKDDNLHDPTVKTCVPFLDSLILGYIIPFDQDYLVDPIENDFSVTPANKNASSEFHDKEQLPKEWQKISGEKVGKFMNKWLIKTPPGYSCLFVQPMNRMEERFDIIPGVVDTDTYLNLINFPYFLKKRDEQFLFKRGEPMVQVIPFKREPWKMWSGFYYEKAHSKILNILNNEWMDRYKKYFWSKKSFK
jgi:hypothetical protein|tara:strand:- start:1443 stop:2126 length:684 start_codon:yes stop_codon:yes gene_type:complete